MWGTGPGESSSSVMELLLRKGEPSELLPLRETAVTVVSVPYFCPGILVRAM